MKIRYLRLLLFFFIPFIFSYAQVKKGKTVKGGKAASATGKFPYLKQQPPVLLKGGKKISLNIQNARIQDIIRLFQEKTGLNILASDKIYGSFTAYVKDVPAKDALRSILEVNQLYFIEDPDANLIRIVTRGEYEDYAVTHLIREKVFVIHIGKAAQVADAIRPMMTKGISRLLVDNKNNRLVVFDVPERLEKISKVVKAFTSPPGQVLIECYIYEITLDSSHEFGLDWSVLDVPNIIQQVKTTFIPRDANDANSPANPGLTIIRSDNLPKGGTVEALLHMVAGDQKIKNISNPRILAQPNRKAEIHVGRQIPYNETVTQGLTGTQNSSFKFLDTGTKLTVIPSISAKGKIQLKLQVEISTSPGFIEFGENGSAGKAPEKLSTTVQTTVLSEDNDLIILGGLIKTEDSYEDKGIPLLKDIPLIKYLFSYRKLSKKRTETVIFFRPKKVNPDTYETVPKKYREAAEKLGKS
ncbi:MAG: hypothetical protein D6767_07625 [Candidatus Hydrogenedentota bacterium]|nr:MAG: hypothetical protein D6767_07625 [Candidatus Hydrogenedentota bacterium]